MSAWTRFIQSRRTKRTAILVVLWAVILGLLVAIREILLPFFLAVFLAYVIEPAVKRLSGVELSGRRLPRAASVLGLYSAAFLALWVAAVFVVPQLYGEVGRLWKTTAGFLTHVDEAQIERAADRLDQLAERLGLPIDVVAGDEALALAEPGQLAPPTTRPGSSIGLPSDEPPADEPPAVAPDDVEEKLLYTVNLTTEIKQAITKALELLQKETGNLAVRAQAVVGGVVNFVLKFFLVLMLTAFLAVDTYRIKQFFFSLTPMEDRADYDDLLARIDNGLSGVVRGQLTICVVNGLLTLVGLLLLKVKFAFLLASVAAIFSLIPIFGSILSTLPIVVVALVTSGAGTAALALGWIVGIHALEANFLNPKILGDAARIHPAVVVLALVAGEHFYGIPGALFAVPVTSIGVTLFKALRDRAQNLEDHRTTTPRAPKGPHPPPRAHRELLS